MDNNSARFKVLHMFSGSGGAAFGMQQSQYEYKGVLGSFETLCGIDVDPDCCNDFEKLTGTPGVQMDLFSREQFTAFHGHEPSDNWIEAEPGDILLACRGKHPDVVFLSPPCKGFSGLLPEKTARLDKYQALNSLVYRSMWLTCEAFRDDLPAVIMIENVPRITTRGSRLLEQVKSLLSSYGYVFHEGSHDCGEIGQLGQIRKRYLLIARNPEKLPSFIYQPQKYKHKTIGEVLNKLPLPGDIEKCGPMHRIPKLQWKTWVRLALIPAGGDWRDLQRDCYANVYQVVPWDEPGKTITGAHRPNNGAVSIADPRLDYDPRNGAFRIVPWDETSPTVTGSTGAGRSNGISGIADPRLNPKSPKFNHAYKIEKWDNPAGTIASGTGPSSGSTCIADPRLNCSPRSGTYKVMKWDEPAKTVIASGDVHAGAAAVADPRIPKDTESGNWIIVAIDGTWHRPLTTYEMAMLQGFPETLADGTPLLLSGKSDAKWREWIGNAVPPPAACGIGNALLETMVPNMMGEWFWGYGDSVLWVTPKVQSDEEKTPELNS